jgi:hypothetical protein
MNQRACGIFGQTYSQYFQVAFTSSDPGLTVNNVFIEVAQASDPYNFFYNARSNSALRTGDPYVASSFYAYTGTFGESQVGPGVQGRVWLTRWPWWGMLLGQSYEGGR